MSDLSPTNLFSVEGIVAVVTGGGTGIGLMIAKALENNGAIVYILGRRLDVLQKAATENNKYGNIIPVKGDVTSQEDIVSLVEKVKSEQGFINLLVNNSGIMHNRIAKPAPKDIKSFQEHLWNAGTPEEFNKTFEVNSTAIYYTTVAFLELLHEGNQRRKSADAPTSQVITVSSIGGLRRDEHVSSLSYTASKAASLHMGKVFANVLAPWKIRSNVIAPGLYPSEMTMGSLVKEAGEVNVNDVPLQRYGTEEDMGGLALFLASKAGGYVTGGVHITDGGRLGLFSASF